MPVPWDLVLYGVLYLVAATGAGVLIGLVAESRGRRFSLGFWLSVLVSPVIALLVVLAWPAKPPGAAREPLAIALAKAQAKRDAQRADRAALGEQR